MKAEEDGDNPNPHTPKVSKTRRFMAVFVIMSVASLITSTIENIFLAHIDNGSALHCVIFMSIYVLFSCMRSTGLCRYIHHFSKFVKPYKVLQGPPYLT